MQDMQQLWSEVLIGAHVREIVYNWEGTKHKKHQLVLIWTTSPHLFFHMTGTNQVFVFVVYHANVTPESKGQAD